MSIMKNIEDLFKSMDFTIFGMKSDKNIARNPKNMKDFRANIATKYCNLEFGIDLNW